MVTGMIQARRGSASGLVALFVSCLAILGAVSTAGGSALPYKLAAPAAESAFHAGIAVVQGTAQTPASALSAVLAQTEVALQPSGRDPAAGRPGLLLAVVGSSVFLLRLSRTNCDRTDRPAAPRNVAGVGQSGRAPPFTS
jgi:hypothetical protein